MEDYHNQTIKLNFTETICITMALLHNINDLKNMLEDNPEQSKNFVKHTLEKIELLIALRKKVGEYFALGED